MKDTWVRRWYFAFPLFCFLLLADSGGHLRVAHAQSCPPGSNPDDPSCEGQSGDLGVVGLIAGGGVVVGVLLAKFGDDILAAGRDVLEFLGVWNDDAVRDVRTARTAVAEAGRIQGTELGRTSQVTPIAFTGGIPAPTSAVELEPTAPPEQQGKAAPEADVQALRLPAGDPASEEAATDPVSLYRGEFVYSVVDHDMSGEDPKLAFIRTYKSRTKFNGPLGPAWDHNYNIRIFRDTNPNICDDELTLSLGDLRSVPMRPDSSSLARVSYRPVAHGLDLTLDRLRATDFNQHCRWELRLPDAQRYCFDEDGLATMLVSPRGNHLSIEWEVFFEDDQREHRVARVTRTVRGEATHVLGFHYEPDGSRLTSTDLTLSGQQGTVVSYTYTSAGQLWQVRDEGLRATYAYAAVDHPNPQDRVPLEGLPEYCRGLCAPERPLGCGLPTSYCQRVASQTAGQCGATCASGCADRCAQAYLLSRPDAIQACSKGDSSKVRDCAAAYDGIKESYVSSCVEGCQPTCVQQCSNVDRLASNCQRGCFESCMGLATDSTRYVYGEERDLLNNLESVVDGDGRRVVFNQYGTDPRLPSFDAVIEQQQGLDSPLVTLRYADLEPRGASQFLRRNVANGLTSVSAGGVTMDVPFALTAREHAPDGTLRICEQDLKRTFTNLGLAPVNGSFLVALRQSPSVRLRDLPAGRVFLGQLQPGGALRFADAPNHFFATPRLLFGGLRADIARSGTVVSPTTAIERVTLTAGRVAPITAPTVGAVESIRHVAIYTSESLTLNDRVRVQTAGGGWAGIANAGTGTLTLGRSAASGRVQSRGGTWLRDFAEVHGDVESAGEIRRQNGTRVEGVIAPATSLAALPIDLVVPFPSGAASSVDVEPAAQTALPPGRYGALNAKSRSKLFLSSGVYYFDRAMIEADAELRLSTGAGPVYLYVRDSFTYGGVIASDRSTHDGLFVGYVGSSAVAIHRPFSGTIVAPNASVILASVGAAGHNGSFFARHVEVHQDAVVRLFPFRDAWTGPPRPGSGDFEPSRTFSEPVPLRLPDRALARKGQSGRGSLTLTYSGGSCRYAAGLDVLPGDLMAALSPVQFQLRSCTTGARAGDVITTSSVGLEVSDGVTPDVNGEMRVELRLEVATPPAPAGARLAQALGATAGDFVAAVSGARGIELLGVVSGAVALTRGTCNRPFELRQDQTGVAQMDPPDACDGSLRAVPIASLKSEFAESFTALAGGAPMVDMTSIGAQSAAGRAVLPLEDDSVALDEWSRAVVAFESAGRTLLGSLSGSAFLAAPPVPTTPRGAELLLSRVELIAQHRSELVRHQVAERILAIRAGSLAGDFVLGEVEPVPTGLGVFFRPRPAERSSSAVLDLLATAGFGPSRLLPSKPFPDNCDTKFYLPPHQAAAPLDRARARWATRVTASDREALIAYYNGDGDNLRLVNSTRGVVDDFEYDKNHTRIGHLRHPTTSLAALEPRICTTADERGLTTTRSRIATQGGADTQCMAYHPDGPWLTHVSHPDDANDILASRAVDSAGRTLSSANDAGEVTTYAYSGGRLDSVTDPSRTVDRFEEYDPVIGLPRRITEDATGAARVTHLTYDFWGHVATSTKPGWGNSESWVWHDHARLDFHEVSGDIAEYREDYTYNGSGQVKTIIGTQPLSSRAFEYDSAGFLQRVEHTSEDRTRVVCYDRRSDGSIEGLTDWNGAEWRSTRDYAGTSRLETWRVSAATDPNCALPPDDVEGELPLGPVTSTRIDGADRVVDFVDEAGVSTIFEYDTMGRVFSVSEGGGRRRTSTAHYYDKLDRSIAALDLQGPGQAPASLQETQDLGAITGAVRATFREYDAAGRVERDVSYVKHPEVGFEKMREVDVAFDVTRRRTVTTEHTVSGPHVVTTDLDGLGRVVSESDNLGNSTTASYPELTVQELTTTGPEGTDIAVRRTFTLDGDLRSTSIAGDEISFNEYDAAGRVLFTEDEAMRTSFEYDGFSQPKLVRRSERGSDSELEFERFEYDSRGRLLTAFAGDRQVASYAYDLLYRPVRETRTVTTALGPSSVDRTTTYVGGSTLPDAMTLPSGRRLAFAYVPGLALLDAVTADATGVEELAGPASLTADFDYTAGHLTSARLTRGRTVLSDVSRDVDGAGRSVVERSGADHVVERVYGLGTGVTSLVNNGRTFEYSRRADGLLQRISDGNAELVRMTYLGGAQAKTVRYGNATTDTRSFDERGRIVRQELDAELAFEYGYGVDGQTRRVSVEDADGARSLLLGLDAIGRVNSELRAVPGPVSTLRSGRITNSDVARFASEAAAVRGYTFDSAGNWTNVSARSERLLEPAPDSANAYAQTPLGAASYDADGRLVRAGNRELRYDAFGNLAEVTDVGLVCLYGYDALGRRISETCNGATVSFGYDEVDLVAERTGAQITRTVHAGGLNTPVAQIGPGGRRFLIASKDGSIRAVLNADGDIIERNHYTAFGETSVTRPAGASPTGNRFGFQGHVHDPLTGFYQMRARYYAPAWGRFVTPDPVGVAGGANLYAFAGNRPQDLWDPFGLTPQANPMGERVRTGAPQPCVGSCEARDGRSRLDHFDARTDSEKIIAFLRDAQGGSCDPAVASCPEHEGPQRPSLFDPEAGAVACLGPAAQMCAVIARGPVGQFAAKHSQRLIAAAKPHVKRAAAHVADVATRLGSRIADAVSRAGSQQTPARAAGIAAKGSGPASSPNAARLRMQLAAEEAAGAQLPGALTGYTRHGLNQAISRDGVGVSAQAIQNAWQSPLSIAGQSGGRFVMTGENAAIVVNSQGQIISTWATNAAGVRLVP